MSSTDLESETFFLVSIHTIQVNGSTESIEDEKKYKKVR